MSVCHMNRKMHLILKTSSYFRRKYCTCLDRISYRGVNSTLRSNVQVIEDKLITFQNSTLSLANVTLTRIRNAYNITVGKEKLIKTKILKFFKK